jgi:hypothetical protein
MSHLKFTLNSVVLSTLLFLSQGATVQAQKASAFFNSSKVSVDFVGLDFSNVKLVGSEGFNDPAKIQSYYFGAWNGLLIAEIDKYDIKGAFYKNDIDYHLNVTEQLNAQVEYIDLVTNATPDPFTEQELQKMVRQYDTKGLNGEYAVSFIVHSLNKLHERAYLYVVVFNPNNKKVLFSQRMVGAARGFGFRNYWAGAVYDILKQIKKREFRSWRKQF